MPTPDADLGVDEALVRRLLEEQMPDLAGLPLRLVANGWDNLVLRLGDGLAVRVPRRRAAAELVAHEQQVLPAIAARVPVAVPAPVRTGRPSVALPFSWSVVPWFPGTTAAEEDLRRDVPLAEALAAFLAALHVPVPGPLPANPVRGVPLADRAADVRDRFDAGLPRAGELAVLWADALAASVHAGPPLQLHGDLHPANLVVQDGRLAAVIDFGDTTGGDPATDLAAAWLCFDGAARAAFRAALPHDAATWRRARGWALVMASALVLTAEPGSLLARVGAAALAGVLED